MSRIRSWCFTLNNWTQDELDTIIHNFQTSAKYYCIGREVGASGTPHLQGYVYFESGHTLSAVKKKTSNRIHLEKAKGTALQASTYCKKDGDFIEWGECPLQGKRSDLISITAAIKAGKNNEEIFDEFGDKALRVRNHINGARFDMLNTPRNWPMDVRIYYGPPGTGKSKSVYDEFGDDVYPKPVGKWWDGYSGQTCVLIDDFDPDNAFKILFDFYLKLLDRYPLIVEIKGGSCHFRSKTIIFTSNFSHNDWFTDRPNRDAFFRRVNTIVRFNEDGTDDIILNRPVGSSDSVIPSRDFSRFKPPPATLTTPYANPGSNS